MILPAKLLILLLIYGTVLSAPTYDVIGANSVISKEQFVVAELFEHWCDTCTRFDSNYSKLEEEVKSVYPNVHFIKVDLENDQEAWKFYGAESLPHFVFVNKGTPVSYRGDVDEGKLKKWIVSTLKARPKLLDPKKHLKFKLKGSNIRYVFLGDEESFEFDEVEALSRMTSNKIYYTSDLKSLQEYVTNPDLLLKDTFIRIGLKNGNVKSFRGPRFTAVNLKKFMTTSSLKLPEQYSAKLVGELMAEGIPILAIFEKDYSNQNSIQWLESVDYCNVRKSSRL